MVALTRLAYIIAVKRIISNWRLEVVLFTGILLAVSLLSSGLIFSKLARLARNTRELLQFADYFRDHGADLISIQEAIDTSTPAGRRSTMIPTRCRARGRTTTRERL
ncbi:MAG: recombinase family protein [Euryarchaeota archaeon]|nr:recombinase family protein [Euryarchaeota archaeon]